MKPNIHPKYRQVAFHDTGANEYIIVGSTVKTSRTIELDGKTYPYMTLDVSSHSHPFYTGKSKSTKQDGRVARFKKQFSVNTIKANK